MRGTIGVPRETGDRGRPGLPGTPGRPRGPHKPYRIIGRHLAGRPWHGQSTPGASFWHRSPYEPPAWFSRKGQPSPWRRLHPWQRALIWWCVYFGIPAAGWLWLTQRRLAEVLLPSLAAAAAVIVPWLTGQRRKRTRPVPALVRPADVKRHLDHANGTKLLIGMARGGKPVIVRLDTDSPHVGLSSASGGGKSETATGVAVQILHHGGIALILDYKMTSFPWARDMPNVRYCKTIDEIHEGLMWLDGELKRRREAADKTMGYDGSYDKDAVGEQLLVVGDEMNATAEMLGDFWVNVLGNKGPSPAARALRMSLYTGRAHRVHTIAIAQQLTAAAASGGGRAGGAARENLGVRILIWYTDQTAKMLVPELMPLPEIPHQPGRMMICVGRKRTETQAVLWSPAEARDYALSGTVTSFPADGGMPAMTFPGGSLPPLSPPAMNRDNAALGGGEGTRAAIPAPLRRSLREASSDLGTGVIPMRYEALKKARQEHPETFPAGVDTGNGKIYSDHELREWHAARDKRVSSGDA